MKSIKKKILGINYEIQYDEEKKYSEKLIKELSYYDEAYATDIVMCIDTVKEPYIKSSNPKTQYSSENIFGINNTFMNIYWIKDSDKINKIIIKTKYDDINSLMKTAHYIVGMDLTTAHDLIVKQLHENVFVPTVLLERKKALIHGAAFKRGARNILIGGTGGSGKTSLMLSQGKNVTFLSDDMVVVNTKREIFPNYALPKIYAYNIVDDEVLKKKILETKNIFNKTLFSIMSVVDKKMVRARTAPEVLYKLKKDDKNKNNKLDKYFLINRTNVLKTEVFKSSFYVVGQISRRIIETEYSAFFNHLKWHDANCLMNNFKNNFCYKKVLKEQKYLMGKALKNVLVFQANVPINIKHETFIKEVSKCLKKQS